MILLVPVVKTLIVKPYGSGNYWEGGLGDNGGTSRAVGDRCGA